MAKVKNPTTLSGYFNIDTQRLRNLGVFDPTLAIDTKLFIDPLLFQQCGHRELNDMAVLHYRRHFEQVISFLDATAHREDVAWRTARRLLEFHEIRGTCLGYGAASIHGSGFGPELTERVLIVGKEIVDLGIRDPDLFPAMALFEADIGPDRLSDMVTNVIREALVAFNQRILQELKLKGEKFDIVGITGKFLRNPFQSRRTPIILIPKDILRKLPIAVDWDDVADAASKNTVIRNRVNKQIGHIWTAKTKRDKGKLREQVLADPSAFQTLLDLLHDVPPKAYDVEKDPEGLIKWAQVAKQFVFDFPLNIKALKQPKKLEDVYKIVIQIIARFQQLIEHNGLNKELYVNKLKPRHESTAQRLFFAVAYCYCEANKIDISPEVDSGSGKIDFKLAKGFDIRVLVEVKLSTNNRLVHGYETQLETYKKAEQTMRAIYLVIDVGKMDRKYKILQKRINETSKRGEPLSDLVLIDGTLKAPASKR